MKKIQVIPIPISLITEQSSPEGRSLQRSYTAQIQVKVLSKWIFILQELRGSPNSFYVGHQKNHSDNFEQRHLNRKISIGHGNKQEEKKKKTTCLWKVKTSMMQKKHLEIVLFKIRTVTVSTPKKKKKKIIGAPEDNSLGRAVQVKPRGAPSSPLPSPPLRHSGPGDHKPTRHGASCCSHT